MSDTSATADPQREADLKAATAGGVIRKVRGVDEPAAEAPKRTRRPLGLRPVAGDETLGGASAVSPPPPDDEKALMAWLGKGNPATQNYVEHAINLLLNGVVEPAADKLNELRGQVSDLKAELIEARHEVRELRLIQESLRISTRGESGRDGARGVPGRDGVQGPVGAKGERGPRGQPGDRIVSWRLEPEEYRVFPITETGKELPALNLYSLFEAFNRATEATEAELAIEEVAHSRAGLELETERVRRGLPAR